MPVTLHPAKHYHKKMTARCMWCFEPFETNHGNAMTCGQRCRSRVARYRKLTGFEPDSPPGNVTVKVAYTKLIENLLRLERLRRGQQIQLTMVPPHKRDELERIHDEEMASARKRWVG